MILKLVYMLKVVIEINFVKKLYTRFGGRVYTIDGFDGIELNAVGGWEFTSGLYGTANVRLGIGDRQDTILVGMIKDL